jgi:transcriptional regulator with XRE-family HTH domain
MRPIHLRMARAALGWTLKDLADRAKVNLNTISRYEAGNEILSGTMHKIEGVLRSEGVVFVDEDEDFQPAIRVRKDVAGPRTEPLFPKTFHAPDRPFTIKPKKSKTKPKSSRK